MFEHITISDTVCLNTLQLMPDVIGLQYTLQLMPWDTLRLMPDVIGLQYTLQLMPWDTLCLTSLVSSGIAVEGYSFPYYEHPAYSATPARSHTRGCHSDIPQFNFS